MVAERFGENVAQLVNSVTEQDKKLSWQERKDEAYEHIQTFTFDQVLVKSADVISNLSDLIEDMKVDAARGTDVAFVHFKGSRKQHFAHALRVIPALIAKWPESPLVADLAAISDNLEQMNSRVNT